MPAWIARGLGYEPVPARIVSKESLMSIPEAASGGASIALRTLHPRACSGFVVGIFVIGSNTPVTPAGYVGYLTLGAVFGRERCLGL